MIYLGIAEDTKSREKVLKAALRKVPHQLTSSDITSLIDDCPAGLTGADFHAIVSNATMKAVHRLTSHLKRLFVFLSSS